MEKTAHMPVDGKILEVNEALVYGNSQILVEQPEGGGWIALILPDRPAEKSGLLIEPINKINYAK